MGGRCKLPASREEIGRASCRERGEISVGAGSLKKKRGNRRWNCDWSSDVCSSDLVSDEHDRARGARIRRWEGGANYRHPERGAKDRHEGWYSLREAVANGS